MKRRERIFEPQFGRLEVDGLTARYLADEKGRQKEERAFEANGKTGETLLIAARSSSQESFRLRECDVFYTSESEKLQAL